MMASTDPFHPEALKDKQRRLRDGFSTALTLRVHRSLSWLRRAQGETDDLDVRFILLWIGFNAAYAGDIEASAVSPAPEGERGLFQAFFSTLVRFDSRHRVYGVSGSVRKFAAAWQPLCLSSLLVASEWRRRVRRLGRKA